MLSDWLFHKPVAALLLSAQNSNKPEPLKLSHLIVAKDFSWAALGYALNEGITTGPGYNGSSAKNSLTPPPPTTTTPPLPHTPNTSPVAVLYTACQFNQGRGDTVLQRCILIISLSDRTLCWSETLMPMYGVSNILEFCSNQCQVTQ